MTIGQSYTVTYSCRGTKTLSGRLFAVTPRPKDSPLFTFKTRSGIAMLPGHFIVEAR